MQKLSRQSATFTKSHLIAIFLMLLVTTMSLGFVWGGIGNVDTAAAVVGSSDNTPVGTSLEGYWTNPPTGYLLEDGSAVSRTTYAALFSVIGTTFGAGDGSTTFNLPDSRGRVAVNVLNPDPDPNPDPFLSVGTTGGEKSHVLSEAEMAQHDHDFAGQKILWGAGVGGVVLFKQQSEPDYVWAVGGATTHTNQIYTMSGTNGWGDSYDIGGGGGHNEIQPYIVGMRVIRY